MTNFLQSILGGATGGATVAITIKAIDEYSRELKRAQGEISEMGKKSVAGAESASRWGWAWKGAAIAGATALVAFGKAAVEQAQEAEMSAQRVKASFGSQSQAIIEYTEQMADRVKVQANELQDAFANMNTALAPLGITTKQQGDLMSAAFDLAATKGQTFNEALQNLVAGVYGNARGLKQYGINAEGAATAQDRLNLILARGTDVLGAYNAQSETYSRMVQEFRYEWQEFKQEIGEGILPLLTDTFKGFKEFRAANQNTAGTIKYLTESTSYWEKGLGYALKTMTYIPGASTGMGFALKVMGVDMRETSTAANQLADEVNGVGQETEILAKEGTKNVKTYADAVQALRDAITDMEASAMDPYTRKMHELNALVAEAKLAGVDQAEVYKLVAEYQKVAASVYKQTTQEIKAQTTAQYELTAAAEAGTGAFAKAIKTMSRRRRERRDYSTDAGGSTNKGLLDEINRNREANGLPPLPGTAHGGIVTSPQVRLVGEAGPEAIVPLNNPRAQGFGSSINIQGNSFYGVNARDIARELAMAISSKVAY